MTAIQEPPYRAQNVRFFDQLSLTAMRSAASASRHFLRLTLSKWQAAFIEDDVLLIASELVTNAITATGVPAAKPTWGELEGLNLVHVRLVGLQDSVVIEVWDASDELPVLTRVNDDSENGRGLLLVQQLADRWGSYRTSGGKVAWAELRVGHTPPTTPLPQRQKSARPAVGPVAGPHVAFLWRVLVGLETAL